MSKVIEYVQVDSVDGVPDNVVPCRHGKVDPVAVDGVLLKSTVGGLTVLTGMTSDPTAGIPGVLKELTDKELVDALTQVREQKIEKLNASYDKLITELGEGYPDKEQASWPTQRDERLRLLAGDTNTPWIDAAAAARGITREAFAELIADNADTFSARHGQLSGTRHLIRDSITATEDPLELLSISCDLSRY